jgi:hypothetical protein
LYVFDDDMRIIWMRKIRVMLAILAVLFTASVIEAKEGFYLGASMVFNDLRGDINTGNTIAPGNGAGLKGGYGLNRFVAIETFYWRTNHDIAGGRSIQLKGGTVDVKVTFQVTGSHIEPYLLVGAGNYLLDTLRGSGWDYGAGMDIYLVPALNFNVGWTRRTIDFGKAPTVSGEVDSMDIGLVYHFP